MAILKKMFDPIDEDALENFESNNVWHYALNVGPDQVRVCNNALHMPIDDLVSRRAKMALASLPWALKGWFALRLPAYGRWRMKCA